MTVLVACDLDGTLIYSHRRSGVPAPERELVCVERLDGRTLSFMTPAAHRGLHALGRQVPVMAVTARSLGQYRRVTLVLSSRYAVAANGGLLLVDGVPDRAWSAHLAGVLRAVAPLDEVQRHLQAVCAPSWTKRIMDVEHLFCCVVLDADALPGGWLAEQQGWAQERGWRVSLQGSKLYVVPQPVDKAVAVAEVARRIGADTVVAAGDALLDAAMLRSATRAVHPSSGELADTGWSAPGVHRVPGVGAAGGEQIVDWLRAQVSDADDDDDVEAAAG